MTCLAALTLYLVPSHLFHYILHSTEVQSHLHLSPQKLDIKSASSRNLIVMPSYNKDKQFIVLAHEGLWTTQTQLRSLYASRGLHLFSYRTDCVLLPSWQTLQRSFDKTEVSWQWGKEGQRLRKEYNMQGWSLSFENKYSISNFSSLFTHNSLYCIVYQLLSIWICHSLGHISL